MSTYQEIYEHYAQFWTARGVRPASFDVWYSHQYSPKANTNG